MTDIATLERQIGTPPGDSAFRITTANKDAVRQWLAAKGFDAGRAASCREDTLRKAYAIPSYLHAMMTRGDYNPNVARRGNPTPAAPERPKCPKCGALHDDYTRSLCSKCNAAEYRPEPIRVDCPTCGYAKVFGSDCPNPACDTNKPLALSPSMIMPAQSDPLPGWQPAPTPQGTPKPMQNGHAVNGADTFDALRMIQSGIQAIAGQAINEQRVIELIQEHAPVRETVRDRIIVQANGATRELPDELRHEAFPDVLTAMLANIPVMLVGPAGTGKTTLGKQLAATAERPFGHIGAVTSRFELSGFVDGHGNYQATPFFRAYTEGHVFLFDEVDGSDPAALLWCNTAIANGFCAFPHGEHERHPEFRLIAAANTYGHGQDRVYAGRNQLDGASLDRFIVIDFNYDEKLERALFGDTAWTSTVQSARHAVADLKLRHVVSSRAIDYGRKLIAAGLPQDRVEKMTLWKGLDSATVAKIQNRMLGN